MKRKDFIAPFLVLHMEKEAICLDTNILVGKGKQIIKEWRKNKREPIEKVIEKVLNKKEGFLFNSNDYYIYLTSIISRYEFVNSLKKEEGMPKHVLIELYEAIRKKYVIVEITFREFGEFMTYNFFEDLVKCDIDLADGVQIFVASKRKLPFVSGNTQHIGGMKKFYSEIFSIEDMYKKIDLKRKSQSFRMILF